MCNFYCFSFPQNDNIPNLNVLHTQTYEKERKKTCSIAAIQFNVKIDIYACIMFGGSVRNYAPTSFMCTYKDIITEYPINFNIVWTKQQTNK